MRFKALIDKKYADEVRQYRWYGTVNDGGIYASSDIDGKRIYLQNFIYEKKTGIKAHGVSFENKVYYVCYLAVTKGRHHLNDLLLRCLAMHAKSAGWRIFRTAI